MWIYVINSHMKFQFLMVQLKVPASQQGCSIVKFQFLMVQLKEHSSIIPSPSLSGFQFLMVQLKDRSYIEVTFLPRVSIPNGSIKSKFPERKYSVTRMFQFLMVQLKAMSPSQLAQRNKCFNS